MGCVYVAWNVVNGMGYVGKTIYDLPWRKNGHEQDAYNGSPCYFHRAIRKYGWDAFEWTILAEDDDDEWLLLMEQKWIKRLGTKVPNGYNMTDGGEGVSGHSPSKETREKIGKHFSELWKDENYRNKMMEIRNDPGTVSRISSSLKKYMSDPEVRKTMSLTQKEAQNRPEVVEKKRSVSLVVQNYSEVVEKKRVSQTKAMSDPSVRKRLVDSVNTEEAKRKKIESMKAYDSKPGTKEKRSAAARKAAQRPDVQEKLRRKKSSNGNRGKTYEEIYGPEKAAAMREARHRKHSEDTRIRMSNSAKLRWADKKVV